MHFGKLGIAALANSLFIIGGVCSASENQFASKIIKVETEGDPGSAFVLGPTSRGSCLLVTAYHVIKNNAPNEPLKFILPNLKPNSKSISFTLSRSAFKRADDNLDLAFTPTASCKYSINIPLARASSIVVSSKVSIMGYPFDQEGNQLNTINPLQVSGRITQFGDKDELGYDLSYDALTKPGYSGGPVLSEDGSELVAIHGRSDTVKNNQDSELREKLRVGGRGISSANLYKFLKEYGYVLPRSDKATCLVGVC